jgi:OmcA/MtrC family decaheme c-type cytochrome
MIHKIHMGKNLPSVAENGATTVLGSTGFAKGGFPQNITNCEKCHDNAVANDGDNWMNVPSIEACGSCHDTVTFDGVASTGISGDPITHLSRNNTQCAGCHAGSGDEYDIANVHRWSQVVAEAAAWANVINSATYDSGTGVVTVTFRVTHSAVNEHLETGTAWVQGSASRLSVNVGWKDVDKADYTSPGADQTAPGAPVEIQVVSNGVFKTGVTNNGSDVYTVTTTLPAAVQASAGTAVVFIDGHPAVNVTGVTALGYDRIPVANAITQIAINDSSADTRRVVVANNLSACTTCHDTLSLHGQNRQGDIRVCTTCHNSANTDIVRRPVSGSVDGKDEESIDMKYLIHRIHRGRDSLAGGITVYGYGTPPTGNPGSPNVFAGEFPRGSMLNACDTCHSGDSYKPPLAEGMEGTTIDSGSVGHADDLNISPTTAVCSGCHDSNIAKGHMVLMGGSLSVLEADSLY